MDKKRVLFLCTGNSARSQMAEGLVNHLLRDRWEAYSAGTQPAGYVHPMAVQALADWEIDIAPQRSKSLQEFRDADFDIVITVCDDAARNCPAWWGSGERVHLGFTDPAAATGDADTQLALFRQVRDELWERLFDELYSFEYARAADAAPQAVGFSGSLVIRGEAA